MVRVRLSPDCRGLCGPGVPSGFSQGSWVPAHGMEIGLLTELDLTHVGGAGKWVSAWGELKDGHVGAVRTPEITAGQVPTVRLRGELRRGSVNCRLQEAVEFV